MICQSKGWKYQSWSVFYWSTTDLNQNLISKMSKSITVTNETPPHIYPQPFRGLTVQTVAQWLPCSMWCLPKKELVVNIPVQREVESNKLSAPTHGNVCTTWFCFGKVFFKMCSQKPYVERWKGDRDTRARAQWSHFPDAPLLMARNASRKLPKPFFKTASTCSSVTTERTSALQRGASVQPPHRAGF